MLRWCHEAGIELATVYLLSTENLQRDPDELAALIEIITDVVEEICAPANHWSVRTVGDLGLIGEEPARRLRGAVESTPEVASFHVNVAVGYGGRREIVDAVRALFEQGNSPTGPPREELVDAVTVEGILGKPVHLRPTRPRFGDTHPPASKPLSGFLAGGKSALLGDVGSPRRTWPAFSPPSIFYAALGELQVGRHPPLREGNPGQDALWLRLFGCLPRVPI
ncbi:conserved hypothetical protein [Mycobacterium tuberculosis variant africanum K85]|uniref:(2Z,6E)-farnesyl diphosphate synthase n=1 Tax=Mycobacterium tuberculosis variant africanum K85 TaxID=611304 RepID=A0A9P2M3W0_MYCTX|nr:conserved hypothetical protein [Mycobacterium tuberculosis variant africanum K85]